MSTELYIMVTLLCAATNIPGMVRGYWWSYLSAGFILGMLVTGLVYGHA